HAEHLVIRVGVRERAANGCYELGTLQRANRPLATTVVLGRRQLRLVALGQTTGHGEQMPHGYPCRCCSIHDAEPPQVALYRRVEIYLPRVDKLQDRERGARLSTRPDPKRSLRRHRSARGIGMTVPFQKDDAV